MEGNANSKEVKEMEEATAAFREKYWSELTDSEKIERLRREVKSLWLQNNYVRRLVEDLAAHEHSPSGKVLCALQPHKLTGVLSTDQGKGDDVYF